MKKILYLIWIVLAGLGGAALRGMSLLHGYEADTGLPVEGYLPAMALIGLTVAVALTALLTGRLGFQSRSSWSFEQMYGNMPLLLRLVCMLCGLGAAGICAWGMYSLPDQVAEQAAVYGDQILLPGRLIVTATAVAWGLGVLSGLCMLLLARGQGSKPATRLTGLCCTVPIFWCCLDLIMVYHENSGNPVLSDYSYLLLMIIAVMASFHSIGTYLYSASGSGARWIAVAGMAVYLVFVNAGGTAAAIWQTGAAAGILERFGTGNTLRIGALALAGLYLLIQLGCTLGKKEKQA